MDNELDTSVDTDELENIATFLLEGAVIIQTFVKTLSDQPGVYRMINQDGVVLYVGKAKSLKKRVVAYTLISKLPNRLQRMVSQTKSMEVITTHTETEALLLESNLIKKFQPRYNILLKDDKSFPYILLTGGHDFPRLTKHRGAQTIKGQYYGPFASPSAVDETLLTLYKIFQLRSCTDSYFKNRKRPCLQYHIKRCSAPCVNKISVEDYDHLVKQSQAFLQGKTDQIQQSLATKMHQASEAMAFEEAAVYRDRIRQLTQIQSHQRINVQGIVDADIISLESLGGQHCVQIFLFRQGKNYGTESFFLVHGDDVSAEANIAAFINQFYQERSPPPLVLLSHEPNELSLIEMALREQHKVKTVWEVPKKGIKRELVDHALNNARESLTRRLSETASLTKVFNEITEVFKLSKRPARIEAYDNSHLQGTHPYGVMVVATQQGFDKKSYRKFAMKGVETASRPDGGDDYAMMREVMQRRFSHIDEEQWSIPDLILLDGGLGQLNAAFQVLQEMNLDHIPLAAIAKGPERNAGKERFFMREQDEPFSLSENSHTLHFLQRLRDEAHRFAIGAHRGKRQKVLTKSILDDIGGIGKTRKKLLLQHFGSAQAVARAALQDLQLVSGINKLVAKKVYQYFHEQ